MSPINHLRVCMQDCGIVSAMFAVAEMDRVKKYSTLTAARFGNTFRSFGSDFNPTPKHPPEAQSGKQRPCSCGGTCSKCEGEHASEDHAPHRGHSFGSISVERKNGIVHGPAGGANSFAECPAQWKPAANAAQRLGADWLENVVSGLSNLPNPIPPPVANLLTRHFHTTYDKDLAKILDKYKRLNKAINQSIDFQCMRKCDKDVLAFVRSIWSELYLCPYWFNSGAELQASTVIHELAHDVVGCDDNAYEWETTKYARMSVGEAMNNADSYAHFAWDASRP